MTRRSQAGDNEAFGELITKYRAKIFTMVYCIVGNEQDAMKSSERCPFLPIPFVEVLKGFNVGVTKFSTPVNP